MEVQGYQWNLWFTKDTTYQSHLKNLRVPGSLAWYVSSINPERAWLEAQRRRSLRLGNSHQVSKGNRSRPACNVSSLTKMDMLCVPFSQISTCLLALMVCRLQHSVLAGVQHMQWWWTFFWLLVKTLVGSCVHLPRPMRIQYEQCAYLTMVLNVNASAFRGHFW